MKSENVRAEVQHLKSEMAALEELLRVYEQSAVDQSGRVEAAMAQVREHAEALRAIVLGTATVSGVDFFRSLVAHLATVLQTRYAFIGVLHETDPGRVRTLAVWAGNAFADNFEYDLRGTPCANVVDKTLCVYERGVQRQFPEDALLARLRAESYGGVPLTGRDGRPLGLLVVLHDQPLRNGERVRQMLTIFGARAAVELERNRALEELRRSEARYRALVENTYDLICEVSSDARFRYVSPNYLDVLGYTSRDLVGRNIFELVHPQDLAAVLAEFQKDKGTATFRYLHKNGEWRWIEGTGKWFLAANGERMAVVISRCITARKRAEEALRLSEERYRTLVEQASDGIFVSDSSGRYLDVNSRGCEMLGYTREELLHLTVRDLIPADDLVSDPLRLEAVSSVQVEIKRRRLRRKDGSLMYTEFSAKRLPDGRIQAIVRDISDRLRLEEQVREAAKMEAVGRLAGGVAHDFNNLLTVINGHSELLRRQMGPQDPLRRHAEEIRKAGERAATLTQQLLTFSRRQAVEPRIVDLNAVVTESTRMLRRLLGEDILLTTRLATSPALIMADVGQLEQVIVNLAVNAREAMPHGGTLAIESITHVSENSGPVAHLVVRDNGPGMDRDTSARIFEPFFTTKEVGKGPGLGLAMVYGIVTQCGGTITVDSVPGEGTTFTIELPMATAGQLGTAPPADQRLRGTRGETILLVEDEPIVRRFVREALTGLGYQVLEAANGPDALQRAAAYAGPIHLLLTDVVMPGMSGRQLAEQVGASRPDLRVLFMSGHSDEAILRHGIKESGQGFLQKPFAPDALARKVRELLDAGTRRSGMA